MSFLYTAREMQEALRELRIKPKEGKVTSQEAARILTWRAEREHNVSHTYTASAVRRHIQTGSLKVAEAVSARQNMYRVEDIFEVPLKPRKQKGEGTESKKAA